MIGERNWLAGKLNFTLNIIDYIGVCTPSPFPLPPSHPKDKKTLKDVMKNTHQHPLVPLPFFLETCASEERERERNKKQKNTFPDNILLPVTLGI